MLGDLPSGLLYWRDGTLPKLFLATRMPWAAGERPTTPNEITLSVTISQMRLPIGMRSASFTPKPLLNRSYSSFRYGGGSFPSLPLERYHFAYRMPPAAVMFDGKI